MKKVILTLALGLCAQIALAQDSVSRQDRFNQYGKLVNREILSAENRNGVLIFESKDQSYKLWFDMRVQIDGQVFTGKTFNPIGNGVAIRRARFAAKTNLSKNWYGELDVNFVAGLLELNDAYISYDFLNGLTSRVGNYKERFSMSDNSSSRYLNFMERAMVVSTFAPSRHIGWEAAYSGKRFLATGGIFFQEVEDAEKKVYTEDNNKDYGRDQGISLTGKLVLQPFGDKADYGLHLAYAHSYRQPKTDVAPSEYGFARYSTRSLSFINRKKYLDTDVIPDLDYQMMSNIEVAGFYKGFGFQSEFIKDRTFRKNGKPALNFGGCYVQATYLLFGGKQFYNKAEGEFSQPYRGKKWGDIELAIRYDYIDLNDKTIYGGSAEGFTGGVNFYADKNVKFQLNYSYVNHDRYATGKGKLYTGYDVSGVLTKDPTKVADANGKAGEDFGMLGIRCEINF